MQPVTALRRQAVMQVRPVAHFLIVAAFALVLSSLPVARVAACSCAMGQTDAQIRTARLAFVGTVVDQRETGGANPVGNAMVEYAFEVDRASGPTNALTVVSAGQGEASCGMTFATGEEWLIIVPPATDMGDTHLCAGNLRLADIGADERADIEALLPVIPAPAGEAAWRPPGWAGPALLAGTTILLLAFAGLAAFRRSTRWG